MRNVLCAALIFVLSFAAIEVPAQEQDISSQQNVLAINYQGFDSNDYVFTADNAPGAALILPINMPDQPTLPIGVSELKDVAEFYFATFEAYINASSDGNIGTADLQYLLKPAMLLIPAFSGASTIPNELANLTDDQINVLLLTANEYQLGGYAQRAKQTFKAILVLAQTYFIYANAASQ